MLRALDRDLWCLDADLRVQAGFHLPIRMTVVRLAEGGLWLHSPIAIDDAVAAELEALGPIRHIVAPSLMHHLFARPACERWPSATLHAPASLASKRSDLAIERPLAEDSRWPELAIVAIEGAPKLDEFVFVHRPSGSLIVTDLVFNVHAVAGLMSPMILRMVGAWRALAQSRIWRATTKDRVAAKASVERVLALEFARLVPAHGEVVEGQDTRERVRAALHWMLA
ncbi:DUF4336 domain-containing protein [Nannocystaceae bacterium ST9]